MEDIIVKSIELVVLATNDYAAVLEKTTEIYQSLDHQKASELMINSEVIEEKLKELEEAELRLYKAQRMK